MNTTMNETFDTAQRSSSFVSPVQVTDNYINENSWRTKENSNVTKSIGGLILYQSGVIASAYWLDKIYSKEVSDAHRNADIHLHDLCQNSAYCAGWSIRKVLEKGLNGIKNKVQSKPPKHLSAAVQTLVNFLGILQNEHAGAQALNDFDTYLAPFVRIDNLTKKEVSQCIQAFLFNINTPSRWGCFDYDTVIEVESKDQNKKWASCQDLKEGDLIWTFNRDTLKKELKPINKIIKKTSSDFVSIKSGEYEQYVTDCHNVLMNNGSFEIARNIKIGDILIDNVIVEDVIKTKTEDTPVWCVNTDNNTVYAFRDSKEFITGNSQAPFSNITLDFTPPEDIKNDNPKIGGKKVDFTYGDLQEEMDLINTCFFEEIQRGDGFGGLFQYPIITVNVTKDFRWDSKVVDLLFEITAKQGTPYFANFINSDMDPSDSRSMCSVHPESMIRVELEEDIIESDGKFYSMSEAISLGIMNNSESNIKKHKKGDKIKLPIKYNFKYKVLGPNGYETPIARQDNHYDEQMIYVYFDNGSCIPMTREHRHDIIKDKGHEAILSIDLKIGMESESLTGPTKIIKIEERHFNGIAVDFTMPSDAFFANDILTRNCRLRLDLREIRKNITGGLFGSGDETGSIGVVTINLPRIGYLSKSKEEFFSRLESLMELASISLEQKRIFVENMLSNGMYPYTKEYLNNFDNHFSTIGLVGMHECCLNFLKQGIETEEGHAFAIEVLNFMRNKTQDFQVKTKNLYNLEATPAESTAFRLAKHDKERWPDIKCSGEQYAKPYYTNSSNLPVGFTSDPWTMIKHQEEILSKYTGGCVAHIYNDGETKDAQKVKAFMRNVLENSSISYFTYTCNLRICQKHGILGDYDNGNTVCPICKEESINSYSKKLEELRDQQAELIKNLNC